MGDSQGLIDKGNLTSRSAYGYIPIDVTFKTRGDGF